MSCGGRRVGAPSSWMVDPCPGKLGREKQVQRENESASKGEIWESNRSYVRGGKWRSRTRLK